MPEVPQLTLSEVPQDIGKMNAIIYSTLYNKNTYTALKNNHLRIDDHDRYLQGVINGTITPDVHRELLSSIAGREKTGLAYTLYREIRQVDNLNAHPALTADMELLIGRALLQKRNFQSSDFSYDNIEELIPSAHATDVLMYQQRINEYLQSLIASTTDKLPIHDMIKASNRLGEILFGTEKWAIAQQLQLLNSLAEKRARYASKKQGEPISSIPTSKILNAKLERILATSGVVEKKQIPDITIASLPPYKIDTMYPNITIHGSEWTELRSSHLIFNQNEEYETQTLTKELLKQEDLLPKHTITVGNMTLYISDVYQALNRIAVVGFIPHAGKFVARTFYLSDSQATWRYLPSYLHAGKLLFGKGYSEASIMLPIACQYGLNAIYTDQQELKNVNNSSLIFEGTARNRAMIDAMATYRNEVGELPIKLAGNFKTTSGKVRPQEMTFANPQQDAPNFDNLRYSWNQKTKLYGDITVEIYPSHDGRLQYMLCRDTYLASNGKPRVWFGGVEDISQSVTSVGLRQKWVDAGDLVTPAYDYMQQEGGYGNIDNQKGVYIDMYDNYIQYIPTIQEYIQKKFPS